MTLTSVLQQHACLPKSRNTQDVAGRRGIAVAKACIEGSGINKMESIRGASLSNCRYYTEQHGYTFLEVDQSTYVKTPFVTPISWVKIAFLYDLLSKGVEYEWIVMFDCDTLVVNPQYAVESILSELNVTDSHHFVFTEDDPNYKNVSAFNAGIFFMRNSMWALKELERVLQLASDEKFRYHEWWEQAAFQYLYRENTMEEHQKILIVPERWKFNSFHRLNETNKSTVVWHRSGCRKQPECDDLFIRMSKLIKYSSNENRRRVS